MNRQSIFSLWMVLFLTACSGGTMTPTPTAIDGAINAGVALIQQDMYLRLTQQYIENQRIEAGARMTATQQIVDATATQARFEVDAKSTQRAEAATQQAWQVTVSAGKAYDAATAQAQGTATEQANIQATSSAVAQATATQQAVLGLTATVQAKSTEISDKKTQEAPVVFAQQTAVYAQARKTEIELQKTQATMWVSAWGGWLVALFVLAAAGYMLWRKSQIGIIAPDAQGRRPDVFINIGGIPRMISPSQMAGPVLELGAVPNMPALISDDRQREKTRGELIVEAVKSLPPGHPNQAARFVGGLNPTPQSVNIQVIQPSQGGEITQWDADVQARMAEEVEE